MLVSGVFMGILYTGAAGQASEPNTSIKSIEATDSTKVNPMNGRDTVEIDSARFAQMAIQAELSREVEALSRTNLGTEQLSWTHVGHFSVERAGREQVQVFWNNPKEPATPHIWQVVNGPSDDVFYLDPKNGRAATIDFNSLQGNFIPASIAEKAGFTGNKTQFLSKKSDMWDLIQTTDSTTVWVASVDSGSMLLTLRTGKDADQAHAVFEWMRLQPLRSVDLPHDAQKHPILSLELTGEKGTTFKFAVTDWKALDEPMEMDARQLSIKDPERDLQTIAKEWAAEKKANTGQE